MLTAHALRELMDYDQMTGVLTWRKNDRGVRAGMRAGAIYADGRRYVVIKSRRYLASRVAWLHVHGEWPSEIDHVNRERSDDRLANLRIATRSQNCANRDPWAKSGAWGVRYRYGKWQAYAPVDGQQRSLGTFASKQAAVMVATAARRKLHGDFAGA